MISDNNLFQYIENVKNVEIEKFKLEKYIEVLTDKYRSANDPVLLFYEEPEQSYIPSWIYWLVGITTFTCGIIVLLIIDSIKLLKLNQKTKKRNLEIDKENQRIIEDAKEQIPIIEKALKEANNALTKTNQALNTLYAENIIYQKYRSIIPVCSFYDYLASGRCNKLVGTDGAYNLYEIEATNMEFCTKLDNILENHNLMMENQYTFANVINETNHEIERINNSVNLNNLITGIVAVKTLTSK